MTHDERRDPAARASIHAVHVAAADPAGAYLHQDFVQLHRRDLDVLNDETAVILEDKGLHLEGRGWGTESRLESAGVSGKGRWPKGQPSFRGVAGRELNTA